MEKIGILDKSFRHLKSIPGVCTRLASRFIGEIGSIFRFSSQGKLFIYCGVACVTSSSGKMTKTKAVYKANKIAKQALITIAGYSIRFNPECRDYYLKNARKGKLIIMPCAVWQDR